jgi:signal transduction histidine kinase
VQYGATRVLAEAPDAAEATGKILREICGILGWQAGVWWAAENQAKELHCRQIYSTDPAAFGEFTEATWRTVWFFGAGLPGQAWETGKPVWVREVADRESARGAAAKRSGLHGALAFPVQFDETVCGVMEFFSTRIQVPDGALLEMLAAIGSQLGQFIERRRAEEQLRKTSADLARSNTDLQQFAYVASHDLTEPLRTITSYLQLLNDRNRGKLGQEGQEFVKHAVDGAQRMQALIKDLLAYARVDIRARAFEPVESESALQSALANLKLTIEETGTVIEREALPTVNADNLQLTQVFQNLISNAIKFRGQAPARIQIGAERKNGEWLFHVRDSGIGLDPAEAQRVFILFQRLHTRQEYPGTGMGLAICKKIIERHGGRIWVESKPGEGAVFFFTLPAKV